MKYTKYTAALSLMLAAFTSCNEDTLPTNIMPDFTTGDAIEITRVSAILSGGIQTSTIENMTEYGIMVSEISSMPDDPTATRRIPVTSSPEAMRVVADGLKMNSNYYYAPYASCGYNLVKGEVRNFVTLTTSAPSISITEDALTPTSTSCTVKARVEDAGSDKIGTRKGLFMRGFIYKAVDGGDNTTFKSTDPGVSMVTYDQDDAEFTQTLSNLMPGTTYAVRPFGVLNGVGYGLAKNFTTITVSEPSLSTIELSKAIGTSVQLNARVIAQGTDNVIEKGFCYSATNDLPTIENEHVIDESQGEDIEVVLMGLDPGTTYYIRAYAVNGTKENPRYGYGEVQRHRVNDDFSFLDAYYTKEEVEAILAEANAKMEDYNAQARAAEDALKQEIDASLAQSLTKYEELAKENQNNIQDIIQLQQELEKIREDYEARDNAMKTALDNINNELNAKIAEKASKQELVESLTATREDMTKLVEENRNELQKAIDEKASLQALAKVEGMTAELEKKIDELSVTIMQYKSMIDELNTKLTAANQEIAALQTMIAALTQDITDLQQQAKLVEETIATFKQEYDATVGQISDAINGCKQALDTQQALVAELTTKVDALMEAVANLEKETYKNQKDIDELKDQVNDLYNQLANVKATTPMPVEIGTTDFTVLNLEEMQATATIDYAKYCKGYNDLYGVNSMYGEEYYAGLYPIVMTGFVISTVAPNPNVENCERMIVVNSNKAGGNISFSTTIKSLTPGTAYYVRAFAINSFGTTYSDVKTVKMVVEPGSGDNPFPDIKNIKRHNVKGNR